MLVHRVETRDFRNLASVAVEARPRFNVLVGANAQGKTNFLEALYLALCRQSFRAGRTVEMIRFGCSEALVLVSAEVDEIEHEVKVQIQEGSKRVCLDGKASRPETWPTGLTAVLFTPDDLQVPKGNPSDRRRLVDRAVESIWPAYQRVTKDYTKTLRARNSLLREQRSTELLEVYDEQLATGGAKMVAARRRYLTQLAGGFERAFSRISSGGPMARLLYSAPPEVLEAGERTSDLSAVLGDALRRSRERDLARRQTSVGPHCDDIEFRLGDRSVKRYASQGQTRAVVLAFKIAQILDIRERNGHSPVLLLDDVSGELDGEKNTYLFDFLNEISCQLFVTTTRSELLPLIKNRLDFLVVNGTIKR